VYIVGFAILALVLFTVMKFPYQAKESYVEIQEVVVETTEDDHDRPKNVRVCTDVPSNYDVDYNEFVKLVLNGTSDAYCEAWIEVWNHEPTEGKWTMGFVFTVNGMEYPMVTQTKSIGGQRKDKFTFLHNECVTGDTKSGRYEVVSAPTTQECKFETQYEQKIVKEIVEKKIPKERIVTKYETLLQKVLGTNNVEKV
jgi:hypothetical protein